MFKFDSLNFLPAMSPDGDAGEFFKRHYYNLDEFDEVPQMHIEDTGEDDGFAGDYSGDLYEDGDDEFYDFDYDPEDE
ncbi:MAG: hypothetical protein LUD29_06530 [Clostridia bacterium]|nr:hypothetical protein [Clostridia bacterium]